MTRNYTMQRTTKISLGVKDACSIIHMYVSICISLRPCDFGLKCCCLPSFACHSLQQCPLDVQVISVDVPNTVQLDVKETAPGAKGNTVSGGTKEATLETGAVIQVGSGHSVETCI